MPLYFQTSIDHSLPSHIYLHITRVGNHALTHLYDIGTCPSAWLPLPWDWGVGDLSALVQDLQHSMQSLAQSRPVKTRRHKGNLCQVWGRV